MNKEIRFGIILQYFQMAASVLIGLILTPLLLRILGSSEYGLYNLASSVISYLSLFSLGFGSSYLRFYNIYKKNTPGKIKNLNGLYLLVFITIGVVSLIFGFVVAQNTHIFLNDSYSISDHHIAKVLMIILAVNLSISFPASVFTSYITSQEKFIFLKIVNIGKTVISPALSILVLFFGYGSIGVVLATSLISFCVDLVNIFFCFKKIKMKISFKNLEFRLLKDIFIFSIFIAINQLVDQINWQTDKIILGKMVGSVAVSIYAIGSTLNSLYMNFSLAISSVFAPKINKIVVENKPNVNFELTKMMVDIGRIQLFVLLLILTGFIFLGEFFVKFWAGNEYSLSFYVALLLMIPETIPLIQNLAIEIQRAKNMHKFRSLLYLFIAIFNVFLSIVLAFHFGVIGSTLGTTFSLIVGNIIIMNIYYHKKLKLDMKYFWKKILFSLPYLLFPILIGIVLKILGTSTFYDFVRQIILYIAIYSLSLFAFGLNKKEKRVLKYDSAK